MRAVEKNIIREIQFGSNNQVEKNFSCRDRLKKEGYNQYKIYLWDSLIFYHSAKTNKNYFSFCGYMTNTTKGRINAFITGLSGACAGIYQKITSFSTLQKMAIILQKLTVKNIMRSSQMEQ